MKPVPIKSSPHPDHSRRRFGWLVGLCLLVLFWGKPAIADNDSPPTASRQMPTAVGHAMHFAIVPGVGRLKYDPRTAKYDMGRFSELSHDPATRFFVVKNINDVPLTIVRLDTSCICLEAYLKDDSLPLKVLPGQEVSIVVTLDPGMYRESCQHVVSVYLDKQSLPAASLEVTASEDSPITFSPPSLNFGEIAPGQKRTLPLTITLAPGFSGGVDNIGLLSLVSSSPVLQVERLSITPMPIPIRRDADGMVLHTLDEIHPDEKVPTVLTYRVTAASPTIIGHVSAKLMLRDLRVPNILLLNEADLPTQAIFLGNVSISPNSIHFKFARRGRPTYKWALLTGKNRLAVQKLSAQSPADYVTVRLVDAAVVKADPRTPAELRASLPRNVEAFTRTKVLEVVLHSNAPAGWTQTQITVTTGAGKQIVIPVLLDVIPQ